MAAVAALSALGLFALIYRGHVLRSEHLLRHLPATAQAVLRIDVPAIAHSASARALVFGLAGEEGLVEIERHCGVDPRNALAEVAIWAGGPEGEPLRSVGLWLRGSTVDAEALARCYQALVEARGSSVARDTTAAGPWLRSRDGRSALAEVDERTVVTGSTATVAEFLAVSSGAAPTLDSKAEFVEVWHRAGRSGAIRGAFVAPPRWQSALERMGSLGEDASALAGVEAVALTSEADFDTGATLWLDVETPEIARRDAALIEAWASAPPEDLGEPWRTVIESIWVEVDGSWLRITGDLDGLGLP